MPKRYTLLRILGLLAAVTCTCATLALAAQVAPAAREEPEAPGRIVLDAAPEDAARRMPPVVFDHDLHTGGENPGATCGNCHDAKGAPDAKDAKGAKGGYPFRGTAGKTGGALENAFHDNCFSCHEATAGSDLPAGPQKMECRSCHDADALPAPGKTGTRKTGPDKTDGGLDAALHARHIASRLIPAGADGANCAACHHPVETPLSPALQEDSCRSCHMPSSIPKDARNRPFDNASYADAAHAACISCHLTIAASGRAALPVTCRSCHDASVKADYARPSPPRLRAGQPDTVLMGAPASPGDIPFPAVPPPLQGSLPDARLDAAPRSDPAMPPVVFDHKRHEAQADNCVSCHHATMRECSSCHTPTGSAAGSAGGSGVTLSGAMHSPDSERSCVGCHEIRKTAAPECAGCHAITPGPKDAQPRCETCHQPSAARKPLPPGEPPAPERRMDAAIDAVPKDVTVGVLANEYEPAVFPHRAIIRNLAEGIKKTSPGMMHFHAEPYALCASCHHNSPPGAAPPACASCHAPAAPPGASAKDSRLPLKEAYHRQCMTCHAAMNITRPANTDCASCHAGRAAGREGGR